MKFLIIILFFVIVFLSLIPLFHLICVSIYLFFDIDIVNFFKKKSKHFLNCINKNNERKKFLRVQKRKKVQLEKQCKINFDALKFEYDIVYTIINNEVEKLKNSKYQISELYLMLLHKYYNQHLKARFFEKNSVEFINCIVYALHEEPVFVDIKCKDSIIIKEINRDFERNVIKAFKRYYQDIYYDDILVSIENRNELEDKAFFDIIIYKYKILIWSDIIIKILLGDNTYNFINN